MVISFPKLIEINISNLFGVGEEHSIITFEEKDAVICGPNNSGKTNILKTVKLLKDLIIDQKIHTNLERNLFLCGGNSKITANIYHNDSQSAQIALSYKTPISFFGNDLQNAIKSFLKVESEIFVVNFSVEIIRKRSWFNIKYIIIDGKEFYRHNAATSFTGIDGKYYSIPAQSKEIFLIPEYLLKSDLPPIFDPSLS